VVLFIDGICTDMALLSKPLTSQRNCDIIKCNMISQSVEGTPVAPLNPFREPMGGANRQGSGRRITALSGCAKQFSVRSAARVSPLKLFKGGFAAN